MGESAGMVGSASGSRIVQTHPSSQPDFASSLAYHSPHHQYLYTTGGAGDFALPQQFPQDFSSYSTSDVQWNVPPHSAQHLHGQTFVPQNGLPQFDSQYSPQVQQQQFSNAYSSASQPTTIAPSQLGGNSFPTQTATVSPSELWTEFGGAPAQAKQSQPIKRTRQKLDAPNTRSVNTASAPSLPSPKRLKDCPWITIIEDVDSLLLRAFSSPSTNFGNCLNTNLQ